MIPEIFIQRWRKNVDWQTTAQVEQDLIISRALVDLYNELHISKALVFRGGTALNKLFLKPPSRYSEDIDFVQRNVEPIGQTMVECFVIFSLSHSVLLNQSLQEHHIS